MFTVAPASLSAANSAGSRVPRQTLMPRSVSFRSARIRGNATSRAATGSSPACRFTSVTLAGVCWSSNSVSCSARARNRVSARLLRRMPQYRQSSRQKLEISTTARTKTRSPNLARAALAARSWSFAWSRPRERSIAGVGTPGSFIRLKLIPDSRQRNINSSSLEGVLLGFPRQTLQLGRLAARTKAKRVIEATQADAPHYRSRSRFRRKQVQHEIVNGLGILQRLVELSRLRLDGEGCVRITKPRGIGSQCIGGVGQRVEAGINLARKLGQHFDVLGFLLGFAVMNEKCFDRFLRRLLAVINCHVVEGRFTGRGTAGGFQVAPRFDHPCFRFGSGRVSHRASAHDSR